MSSADGMLWFGSMTEDGGSSHMCEGKLSLS
uniref:Uncharacterized protein n=1 Tax=Anguilla anguilla TaxID=7936 RepID=A0A0E9U8W4_ANGAN